LPDSGTGDAKPVTPIPQSLENTELHQVLTANRVIEATVEEREEVRF